MEYTIFCDESLKRGKFYSNFYGGILIRSIDLPSINTSIKTKMEELNLYGEVKWTKITQNYQSKYIDLMTHFFSFVKDGKIKVRIMFTKNCHIPTGLSQEKIENSYFLLYYQFIKHAFGLSQTEHPPWSKLRLNFDQFPNTTEKSKNFKEYIHGLRNTFKPMNLTILPDAIREVSSHEHHVLQCLDIILGSMAFRLNDQHKEKPDGAARRGKKTIAKEKVYKHINSEIRSIYPHFNIGTNTGMLEGKASSWSMHYRHWLFVPKQHIFDPTRTK